MDIDERLPVLETHWFAPPTDESSGTWRHTGARQNHPQGADVCGGRCRMIERCGVGDVSLDEEPSGKVARHATARIAVKVGDQDVMASISQPPGRGGAKTGRAPDYSADVAEPGLCASPATRLATNGSGSLTSSARWSSPHPTNYEPSSLV